MLSEIEKYYPFKKGKITKYAELCRWRAVLFDILQIQFRSGIYHDINAELINTYRIIRDDIDELVDMLTVMQRICADGYRFTQYYLEKDSLQPFEAQRKRNVNVEKAALDFLIKPVSTACSKLTERYVYVP